MRSLGTQASECGRQTHLRYLWVTWDTLCVSLSLSFLTCKIIISKNGYELLCQNDHTHSNGLTHGAQRPGECVLRVCFTRQQQPRAPSLGLQLSQATCPLPGGFTESSQQPWNRGPIIIPASLLRKLKPRDLQDNAQGRTAGILT